MFFFLSFVISRRTILLLSKQYTFIDIFVLFANLETSDDFTVNSIPFKASSNSCYQVLYLVTLCASLSAG